MGVLMNKPHTEVIEIEIAASSLDLIMQLQSDINALETEVYRLRDALAEIQTPKELDGTHFEGWLNYYKDECLRHRAVAANVLN